MRALDRFNALRLLRPPTCHPNANLAGIIDGLDGMESRTLAYDGRDRLTSITGTPGSIGNESFTYDTLDNVRRAVSGAIDRRFHYNASTLRLSQITTINSPNVMDYAWNDRGEMTSRTHTEPGSPPLGPDVIFLNGFEEATISSTETFAFDQARRLVTTFGQMTHTYDAHNHRVATATVMVGTRYQVYSRSGELFYIEDSGSNQRTEFFELGGTLVAERTRPLATESPVVSYLHSDHRGTPSVKTDGSSNVQYRSRLMPYGAPYDNNWREGPGFTKHATDEIAQLSYMQQRYYDPVSMRFLSPDPIAAGPDSFNVYAYANNNPYTFVDPDGRAACPKKSGGSCIDSPRTESGTAQQGGPSTQQRAVDSQVRSASRADRLSDGTKLALSGCNDPVKICSGVTF
jgi:RHS repeat-associated protein